MVTPWNTGTEQQIKDFLASQTPIERTALLEDAAIDNNVDTIEKVLHHSTTNCGRALFWAASQGHTEVVQLLLPFADPQDNDSEAFRVACQFGHLDVVKLLLPVSNPQCNNNNPLRSAAGRGHTDVVRYILPFTDPKDIESSALQSAAFNQHWDVVDMLYDLSDVQQALKNLERCGPGPWQTLENEVAARRQKLRLAEEVQSAPPLIRQKKM